MNNIICINCPLGCRLTVEIKNNEIVSIHGNACKHGDTYARQESVAPMRTLTANMKAVGCSRPFSVKTDKPVPKNILHACALELKNHHPKLPVTMGDTIIKNILGTGSDIIATQDLFE